LIANFMVLRWLGLSKPHPKKVNRKGKDAEKKK
jgi:hypothetical protein